jgi:hypothetical protein
MRAYELLNEQQQLDLNILIKIKDECDKIARYIGTIKTITSTTLTVVGDENTLLDINIIRRVAYNVTKETVNRLVPLRTIPKQQLTEDPSSKEEHYKVLNNRAPKINQYILIVDAFKIILPLIKQLNYDDKIINDVKLVIKSINREALVKLSRRYANI